MRDCVYFIGLSKLLSDVSDSCERNEEFEPCNGSTGVVETNELGTDTGNFGNSDTDREKPLSCVVQAGEDDA